LNAISRPGSGSTSARPPASGGPDLANGFARAASRTTTLALSLSAASGVVGHSKRFCCYIRIARNFGINGNKIILTFELQSVTAHINERDRVRPSGCGLLEEIAKRAAQRILIEIASAGHIEAGCLQRLCDQARIISRRRQCSCLVAGIADDECNAFFGSRDARHEGKHERD
jgi:hypothetical protein